MRPSRTGSLLATGFQLSLFAAVAVVVSMMLPEVADGYQAATAELYIYALMTTLPFLFVVLYTDHGDPSRPNRPTLVSGRRGQHETCSPAALTRDLYILAELYTSGSLTDGEYAREKTRLLRWKVRNRLRVTRPEIDR